MPLWTGKTCFLRTVIDQQKEFLEALLHLETPQSCLCLFLKLTPLKDKKEI